MTVEINLSGNNDIDGVLWGWSWGSTRPEGLGLSYSFPTATTEYINDGYVSITGFTAFTAAQQTAVTQILGNIASFANLTFTLTTNVDAILRYGDATSVDYTDDSSVAGNTGNIAIPTATSNPPELGSPPLSAPYAQGDGWFNGYTNPQLGSFQYFAGLMHETGHNLGLKHGHTTQVGHGVTFPTLPADHDSNEYSVMTYRQFPSDDPTNGDNAPNHPTTYMQDDIAALQYLYGADYGASAHNGNTTYTWSPTTGQESINGVGQGAPNANFVFMTLWDGGGTDTYDFSNYTTNLSVDLNPGQWTILDTSAAQAQRADMGNNGSGGAEYFARGNIANALIDPNNPTETASLIENAIGGSGDDLIKGNAVDNVLTGNGGNDTIDGQGGVDTAVYSGAKSGYTATLLGTGAIQIVDNRGGSPDGTDTDTNTEFFKFADRTYNQIELLNRPPVLSADPGSPHAVTETAGVTGSATPHTLSASLSFTDADSGDTHTASESFISATWSAGGGIPAASNAALVTALSDGISEVADGTSGTLDWSFSLPDSYLDFLAAGETLTAVYNVTVSDHHVGSTVSASSTRPVTIVFTGTNDVPVVVGAQTTPTGSVSELPNVTGSSAIDATTGVVAFSDPDLNDRPTATIDALNETVTWHDLSHTYTLSPAQIAMFGGAIGLGAEAGNTNTGKIDWTFSIFDKQLDFLGVGETVIVTAPLVVDDRNGGTFTQNVVVTVNGANDNPIAAADSNGTAKATTLTVASAKGVLANDTDPDTHDQGTLFVSAVGGSAANVAHAIKATYGSLTLNANGSYTYVANQGSLPSQLVAQDTFNYTVSDTHGGTDTSTLSIVVFGPGVSYKAGINTTLIGGNTKNVLDGSFGNDILIGGNAGDVLIGGSGDTLTGGTGPDKFLFRPKFGKDEITNFNTQNDVIQFNVALFTNFAAVMADTTQVGANTSIKFDANNSITLDNVAASSLSSSNFHFA